MGKNKLGFLLLPLFLTGPGIFAATAQNPIIWADVPDPCVLRVGNNFYMSSTTMHMNPGVPIMKSTNLVNWQVVNYVYPTLANGDKQNLNNGQNEYGQGSWASSLVYKNGVYYASFLSNATGDTYVYQTTNIETGTWTAHHLGGGYHDASLLFDDDGRVYLIYGAGNISVIELTADATAIKSGGLRQTLITNAGSIAGSGGLAAEGTHALKINGKYYIFLISWPTGGVRTELVYRADSLTGPYQGRVILQNPGVGIAQGGVVDTPAGNWYAMLFRDSGAVGRMPYLIPMTWSSDNWPVLGSTTDTGITATVGSQFVACDGFNSGAAPGLMWQWNHNPDNANWSYNSARPGYLRLTNGSVRTDILNAKNTLTQRTFGPQSSAIVAMETTGMKDGDYAGLSAFQFYYGFVGVKVSGSSKSIIMVRGSTNDTSQASTPVEVASVPVNQNRVYLKVSTDFRSQTDKATFFYSLDGIQWTAIGGTLQMAYTIPHFMGYRFGLFTYATKSTGGYADFDYFQLDPAPVGGCSIDGTPSPSVTPTSVIPTATPTFTVTRTNTNTATATPSATPTRTSTPTSTSTLTFTRTWTPTATTTSTATNTATFTATKTNTPVPPTATATFTATSTSTLTRTATPTATSTATNTATFTPTKTNTPVPPTATATSTATWTSTKTNTPVPATATFTSTATKTDTPEPPTATWTNTVVPPSPTPTATLSATRTPTSTNTSVPPTATSTNTAVPPTLTDTPVPPTSTDSATATPTTTKTPTPSSTLTPTASLTATPTASPSQAFTQTAVPPTATWTNTVVPPTDTFTSTKTETPVPPTATSTNTAVPMTRTFTPVPPTATLTNTPVPPTATDALTLTATWSSTRTHTPVPPTATFTPSWTSTPTPTKTWTSTRTYTPVPPTATLTAIPPMATSTPTIAVTSNFKVQLLSAVTSDTTNSPHPQIKVVNTGTGPLNLNNVTVRYWFNCDCTNQTLQAWVDWAGLVPVGTTATGNVQVSVQATSLGGQTDYALYSFTGNLVLQPGQAIQVQSRFNKNDWSNMVQSNDWSFATDTAFTDAPQVTGYMTGSLAWGQEPAGNQASLTVASALAFPNPSTGTGTTLSFTLGDGMGSITTQSVGVPLLLDPNAKITLRVYTLSYQLIWSKTLTGGAYGTSGLHELYWDERDKVGSKLANGTYFFQVTVESNGQTSSSTGKILILG